MKLYRWSFLVLTIAATAAAFARAEGDDWGHGLGHEMKSIYVPYNQQSGWPGTVQPEAVEAPAPKQTAHVVPEGNWTLHGVEFDTASDKLKSASLPALNEAAEILKEHKRVVVEIQGHTDNIGGTENNQALSERRATAVKDYLVQQGIAKDRLVAKGYGETHPVADNTTESGRAINRRIEFKVLQR